MAKKSVFEPIKSIHKSKIKNLPINSEEYLKLNINEIPEEEKFFYNYYKSQKDKKPLLNDVDSDVESISDTEFDAYLMKTEVDGADANDDWGLDFAEGLSKQSKNKRKKAKKDEEEDDDSDSDFDDDGDVLDEFGSDEDFEKEMNEEMEGGEDDDEDGEDENESGGDDEIMMIQKPKKKRGKEDFGSLFAAADEFSHMINESNKYEEMGVGSISNKDNANPKQLKWELQRDGDFTGKNWKKQKTNSKFKNKVNGKSKPTKSKNFSQKKGKISKKPKNFSSSKRKFSKK